MGKDRTDLDWHLQRASERGASEFALNIADLRWQLLQAARHANWDDYEDARKKLNEYGALIPARPIPKKEQLQMGMFDAPQYLTGDKGYVEKGDVFWLHNCRLDGTAKTPNGEREQVKLLVSRERDGEQTVVWTSGAAIVNQVKRMDTDDRRAFPVEVRLDQVPSRQGNPTNVLTPADQPEPSGATAGFDSATSGTTDF